MPSPPAPRRPRIVMLEEALLALLAGKEGAAEQARRVLTIE